MAVLSAQDIERFTPERYLIGGEVPSGAPVYLLAGPTWKERARFRASLASEGVRYPSDAEILRAARAVIAEVAPSNADELLGHLQAFEDVLALPPVASEDEGAGDERERRLEIARAYEGIIDTLRQHPSVSLLLGLRTLFFEIVAPMAAAYALRGWENVSTPFARVNGTVSDRVLDALPLEDLMAIGNRALELQTVSAAQRGN